MQLGGAQEELLLALVEAIEHGEVPKRQTDYGRERGVTRNAIRQASGGLRDKIARRSPRDNPVFLRTHADLVNFLRDLRGGR